MGLEALLASGVDESLGWIPHADGKLVLAFLHEVRDIERKGILPAFVRNIRHLVMPDEHHRAEVYAAEVEQHSFAGFRVA